MNDLQPRIIADARRHQLARVILDHGQAVGEAFARATGADKIGFACAIQDVRDAEEQQETIDDRGDELATHERDDRFAGT